MRRNKAHDALIGQTALREGVTLVTEDRKLRTDAAELGVDLTDAAMITPTPLAPTLTAPETPTETSPASRS